MKEWVLTAIGVVGSFIAGLVGGWDHSIITLMIFMGVDFLTGLLVAYVFKNSTKTESGGGSSSAGFKGLVKKGVTILVVTVAHRLDLELQTTYIRDAVCIAFMTNELISIIENVGLMGIPVPKFIRDALEVLKAKEEAMNKSSSILATAKMKEAEKVESEKKETKKVEKW